MQIDEHSAFRRLLMEFGEIAPLHIMAGLRLWVQRDLTADEQARFKSAACERYEELLPWIATVVCDLLAGSDQLSAEKRKVLTAVSVELLVATAVAAGVVGARELETDDDSLP